MENNNETDLVLPDLPDLYLDRGLADRDAAELRFHENVEAIGNTIDAQQARIAHLKSTLRFVQAYLQVDGKHQRALDEIRKVLK